VTIPHVVHRLWLGGPELAWTAGFADTWRQPGWELRQWTDDDVGELFPLVNQDIYDRAEEIAPNHVGQLRSDVLRYEILHRFGGVYVDTDFQCLRPIDPLLDGVPCFAAWEVPDEWIANGLMGAPAGHTFLQVLIEQLPASVEQHLGFKPNKLTGPQFFTRMWREHGRGVTVLDRALVYPFGWQEVSDYIPGTFDAAEKWPNAFAVHWWANKRRERNLPCR
jgi:inositol phosphorylceramide mannosyltransferase catalytic subunit